MPAATVERDGFDGNAMHYRKNQPERPELEAIIFPPYRFRPFPAAVYREWDVNVRQAQLHRVAAQSGLDLEKRHEFAMADRVVGDYATRLVGVDDLDAEGQVISALRERNERELASLLDNGWADKPDGVKAATARMNQRIALAAGERAYDDRRLAEKARAELDALEAATEGHVVDVAESRRAAVETGALKGKR